MYSKKSGSHLCNWNDEAYSRCNEEDLHCGPMFDWRLLQDKKIQIDLYTKIDDHTHCLIEP